jgi:hypothetical protein
VEDSLASTIGQWRDFQTAVAGAGATLLGLLFVAVSLRPALFGPDTRPEFLSLALKSMGLFMLVVLVALLFLMPEPQPSTIGIALLLMGAISLCSSVPQLGSVLGLMREEWGIFFYLRRVLLPTVGYGVLTVAGIGVLLGNAAWIDVVGWLQWVFLFTATYNAWDLLTHVVRRS